MKSKRHKRSQASPKVVMLILGGVVLALGIVWAVFMKHDGRTGNRYRATEDCRSSGSG